MQPLDFIQRGCSLPELDKAGVFVNKGAVFLMCHLCHLIHGRTPWAGNFSPGFCRRGSNKNCMDNLFKVTMSELGMGVTCSDRFALFGQAETTLDASGRLGPNSTVGRASPARNRATAPVKDGQGNVMLLSDSGDILLPLIQRPVRHDIPAILVAV